jgi:threonyl-tRNA synthetase
MNNIEHEKLYKIRHTLAHVMAYAVKQIFEEVKFGIGPVIEDGFYYDFELPRPLVPEDLNLIEEKMKDIINNGYQVLNEAISFDEAHQMFSDQIYKLELVNELAQSPENSSVSIYKIGDFIDLCKGPHLSSLKELNVKAFKLMRFSGAYWKGDTGNPMLQRIYGTAWERPDELKAYINKIEEASKRDHRTLGTQLDLFSSSQNI